MDQIEKRNYSILLSNVNSIRNRLYELDDLHDELISIQKESLLINNSIISEETQREAGRNINRVIGEINYTVIPSIKNKLYK